MWEELQSTTRLHYSAPDRVFNNHSYFYASLINSVVFCNWISCCSPPTVLHSKQQANGRQIHVDIMQDVSIKCARPFRSLCIRLILEFCSVCWTRNKKDKKLSYFAINVVVKRAGVFSFYCGAFCDAKVSEKTKLIGTRLLGTRWYNF